jgi:hypothetical protein
MSSERIRLEREKAQLVQARARPLRAHLRRLGPQGCGDRRFPRPRERSRFARTRRPSAQGAYASGVLSEAQFSELEELQTPDCLNFVAEGARRPRAAWRRGRALYRQKARFPRPPSLCSCALPPLGRRPLTRAARAVATRPPQWWKRSRMTHRRCCPS